MHDHSPIVLQAIQALKPHGLVTRIRVRGRRVELYLEDGSILSREIPPALTPAEDRPIEQRPPRTRPVHKKTPKD